MNHPQIAKILTGIGDTIARQVHDSLLRQSAEHRTRVAEEHADDTIYQLDADIHGVLVSLLDAAAGDVGGIRLIAEGFPDPGQVFPSTRSPVEARWCVLADPIDGTRGIMYDKRSAYFLAGAALNRKPNPSLQDIEVAVMVEIPTSRSWLSDRFLAIRGEGVEGVTLNWLSGSEERRPVAPSTHESIYGGFAQLSKFFPPGKETLAAIEHRLIERLFPDAPAGRAFLFDDQYISTGGQLVELMMGRDRFNADLRGALNRVRKQSGLAPGLTCHPYDMSAWLVAAEAGILLTGVDGMPLDAPLDTTSPSDWIAYANDSIQAEVEPVLMEVLREFGLIGSAPG